MIVRSPEDGSLILINQTDHAKLSGLYAAHWGNANFATPAPRDSMIRAAMFHDNGWHRYEAAPLYDVTAKTSPNFFQVPTTDEQLAEFGNAIDWLTWIDPYAGLLISRHRTGLYRSRYGAVQQPVSVSRVRNDPKLDAFVAAREAAQEDQLISLDRARFNVDYQLLQFWDLLSLALCVREPRDEVFELVPQDFTGDGCSGVRMTMTVLPGDQIALDPYPFDTNMLTLGYAYRHMPTSDFPDQDAFQVAYFGTTPTLRQFTFRRA